MQEFSGQAVRAFVIWEPVLPTDWSSPSTVTLGRISDTRTTQFWDRARLISHYLGEHDRRSIVWDYIAVYPAGADWVDGLSHAVYHGGPVVRVTGPARRALVQALKMEQVPAR